VHGPKPPFSVGFRSAAPWRRDAARRALGTRLAPWPVGAGRTRPRATSEEDDATDMAESQLHEPAETLSKETREMHRAIVSLIEELEAVDWYAQRIDASADEELARVLAHNRDEEKEHACMTLEWIRRRDPTFDGYLREFLFRSGPIGEAEHGHDGGNGRSQPTLGLGSLREAEASDVPREEETAP
jgi:hypothetical protein